MNFVMNHAPGAGSLARPLDQQSTRYHSAADAPFHLKTITIKISKYITVNESDVSSIWFNYDNKDNIYLAATQTFIYRLFLVHIVSLEARGSVYANGW